MRESVDKNAALIALSEQPTGSVAQRRQVVHFRRLGPVRRVPGPWSRRAPARPRLEQGERQPLRVPFRQRLAGRSTRAGPLLLAAAAVEPLLGEGLDHIASIRIGTKALSYWLYRFTSDRDADELLRLIEDVRRTGRQLALMAHFSHPRELQTGAVREALRRVRDAGAVVRCQAPLIRHVNDRWQDWAEMWREEVRLGLTPYYFFVARNTGPRSYFEVPLAESLRIFARAYGQVSGLGRTVRGSVMSATPNARSRPRERASSAARSACPRPSRPSA